MDRKTIALCMFALVIGIGAILPIAYFTPGLGINTIQAKPVFDPNVCSVAVFPDSTAILSGYGDAAVVDIDAAYAVHSIVHFKDVDAKIEVYNYHIYSDQASIANITHTIAITKNVPDSNSPNGFTSAIMDRSREKSTYTFADGTILDITEVIGYVESSRLSGIIYDQGPTDDLVSMHDIILLSASNGEKSAQALYNMREAQKIYVDVTMVLYVTYKHPNNYSLSSIITTTFANDDVLFHVELTKMDDESFRYDTKETDTPHNTYTPFTPNTSSAPPDTSTFPPNIIKLPDTITWEPAAITLLLKVFTMNSVLQKPIT
ncbi:MAG: hypothetical protein LBC03_05125 [Nitrososphaerota archaeon]|jgi:hypothetical protein|nr:hypothetical protein [Nitrososphaerota archaeon]